MLSQLFIKNIAVIEQASIDLEHGFTVLTGETGAGKSIIIDAIHAVRGERTSTELIRTVAKNASVSALFTSLSPEILEILEELSVPLEEDNSLLIQREIKSEGKSLCKLNGAPATVSMLKQLAPLLLNIHGQHESYELLSPEIHMTYLDRFGELEDLLLQYQSSYRRLREIRQQLGALQMDEGEKARRLDLLRYQVEEIQSANLKPGEQEALIQERDIIRNSEKISVSVELVKALLSGDENSLGLLSGLSQATEEIEKNGQFLSGLQAVAQKLREAGFLLEDADQMLRDISVEFDPERLEMIEERLDLIYRLSLKYGGSEEEILQFLEDAQVSLKKIEFSEEERGALEAGYEAEKQKAISLARELSAKRKAVSQEFSKRVKKELNFLNMPGMEFLLEIERVPLYNMGCDKVQFLISANKGEPAKPLSKIASGGELSRIMLAIKTVLSGKDRVDTLIFDEVDTGISGEAANKVGLKLKEASRDRQVLCITHLAQIAALADHHLRIQKHVKNGRTFTQVEPLDLEGRKQELARIIGGASITELQLKMAEEMLKKA